MMGKRNPVMRPAEDLPDRNLEMKRGGFPAETYKKHGIDEKTSLDRQIQAARSQHSDSKFPEKNAAKDCLEH